MLIDLHPSWRPCSTGRLLQVAATCLGLTLNNLPLAVVASWNQRQIWGQVSSVSMRFNQSEYEHVKDYYDTTTSPRAEKILKQSRNVSSLVDSLLDHNGNVGSGSGIRSMSSWEPGTHVGDARDRDEILPGIGNPTRIVVRHDGSVDVHEDLRFELNCGLASGIVLNSLGAGDYVLEKAGPKWFNRIASRWISGRSRSAILNIVEIIRSFEDYGVVDIFGKYSQPHILMSIVAYRCLQKTFELDGLTDQYHECPKAISGDNNIIDSMLLDNLAHYSVYASAAYGWKLGFAMKGTSLLGKITRHRRMTKKVRSSGPPESARQSHGGHPSWKSPSRSDGGGGSSGWKDVPITDSSFFLRKTGLQESDVVAAEWRSDTHRPGYIIVRDPSRKALVFSIRGTWSFQDVLTDLCCTSQSFSIGQQKRNETQQQERDIPDFPLSFSQRLWHWFYSAAKSSPFQGSSDDTGTNSAHYGMLEAARALLRSTQNIVKRELSKYPDYSLVIVGHSLGGGVAALLGTLWSDVFPVSVFVYGPPCIAPLDSSSLIGFGNGTRTRIVSVAIEGDPFGFISLGHIAELTTVLDRLCADKKLQDQLLRTTLFRRERDKKERQDSWWLLHTMRYLHANCTGEKMYPPGRLLVLKQKRQPTGGRRRGHCGGFRWTIRDVEPHHFSHFQVRPSKMDLSKHMPSLYEEALSALQDTKYGNSRP